MLTETNGTKSSPLLLAAAWLIVLVPTGWGLTYTVQNALKLFRTPAPTAAPTSGRQAVIGR
jgi:hypothetical protein